MYRSGLRISEALALFPRDLDERVGTVRVEQGKGGKSRVAGMDTGAFALVERWLDLREQKRGIGRRQRIFCTLAGGPLSLAYVSQMLKRLAGRAGIEKRVHSHAFRHTFASQLVDEGVDVVTISKLLGHSSIVTTVVYLDHLNPKAAVEAASGRVWKVGRLTR
jgi:site-specific recombinase XerD